MAAVPTPFHDGKRGKRIWISGKTYQEVKEKKDQIENRLQSSTMVEPKRIRISDHVDSWLEQVKKSLALSTYESYERNFRNHIKPMLGHLFVDQLNEFHVEHLLKHMADGNLSPRTQNYICTLLSKFLKHLQKRRILVVNVVGLVDRPKRNTPDIFPLDKAQTDVFLKGIVGDKFEPLYVLAILTGARQGELFALRWKNVDLNSAAIQIEKTLSEAGGKLHEKTPKTKASRRMIHIPKRAVEALHLQRKLLMKQGHASSELVFVDEKGGYLRRQNIQRRSFKPLLKKLELPDIRFHDLRHTHATLLLLAGENVKVVSERLGHSSIRITLDTYAHVLPGMQKQAAEKLDLLFG